MEVIRFAEQHNNNSSNNTLVFAINNKRFELTNLDDSSTTLLQFLRTQTSIKSPKLGCGEGGCGACVVLLSKYDSKVEKVESFTVSSCLTLLGSVHGCSITTSEGIGNSRDGFHEIHRRFGGFHASQCGFCTPGMCMSLYGVLVDKNNNGGGGEKLMTVIEAEKAIAGNLCRCTGYRPILDACKSFAVDVDMEDLGANSFCRLPSYSSGTGGICSSAAFPEFLKMQGKSNSASGSWVVPQSTEELLRLMNGNVKMKLVVGNTGIGYYKEELDDIYDRYIDIRYVPELSRISYNDPNGGGIKFGAAVTISKAITALKASSGSCGVVYRKIADHMEKIATRFVRNTGSIGGNLVMAQRKGFPSDIATLLIAAGSYVEILTDSILKRLTLEEFLQETRPPLADSASVLISIEIPSSKSAVFETYRASPRPLGNALAHLSSAFMAEIDGGDVISSCRLAFGGNGINRTIRARKAEDFLAGKKVTASVVYEAIRLVKHSVAKSSSSDPEYKSSLAVGFVFEFLSPLILINGLVNEACETSYRLLSSGKQIFQVHRENRPVGEPVRKSESLIQASGEAVFVDDIPSPENCLYGAFVWSTKPFARVKGIGFESNRLPDGVVALISSKDIPKCGENLGSKTIFGTETLFADNVTHCAGERLAFVVADSQKKADAAAKMVVVDYDTVGMEPPILTVEDAVKRSSFISVPPFLKPDEVGDVTTGFAEADYRIINAQMKVNSQYYFYMETQTAMAVPDEDNCMVVYSSSQSPEAVGVTIAGCLDLPQHNVRVITRRVGGGFGGKALKSIPIATSCALAAQLLHRPVRTYLNRKTDMIISGGRHPMKVTYTAGFKSNGKITALKLEILIDAGMSPDVSAIIPVHLVAALKKYDWGSLSFDIKLCKTNRSSKSTMRAPGAVQGTFIADTVMENVASALGMDVDDLRAVNLHCYDSLKLFYPRCFGERDEYTLSSIWERVAESSEFHRRREMVEGFNRDNLWRKKGISRVPIVFEAGATTTPGRVSILSDGSIAVEVGGIELGQGLWTKAKQMAAFSLSSLINSDSHYSLLEKVRVTQADTLSLIQGGFTGGSTKSESTCEAIRLCCNVLVERLLPLKEKLQKENNGSIVRWEMLISQAYKSSVNLSASSLYVPDFSTNHYLNYGAAASEVEINLLTGETTILRSDLIYDCGQSLNPAVDMGQIEGAFVQGIGFFMMEEYNTNSDGLVTTDSTWTYKIPTIDTIPKQFNVEILSSGHYRNRVLSSKASGEPPLLLAASVHCATRAAIKEARKQLHSWGGLDDSDYANFHLDAPATMAVVKKFCGLNSVESYLKWKLLNHK